MKQMGKTKETLLKRDFQRYLKPTDFPEQPEFDEEMAEEERWKKTHPGYMQDIDDKNYPPEPSDYQAECQYLEEGLEEERLNK